MPRERTTVHYEPKEHTMRRTLFLFGAALIAAALIAPAPADCATHPGKLKFPRMSVEMPAYEEVSFSNGMTGFFLEDHEIPIVDIHMLIPTSRAPKDKTGLADMAVWVMRNGGTEAWPADRINEELEFIAAQLEFRPGAREATVHLNCLKKDLDLCLGILGDLLRAPAFPEEAIELRRGTMLEDIRRENDEPRGVAFREFRKVLYGDHPMAWRATEETVSSITRDDLVAFHDAYFRPNNVLIGISGDVTKDEIVKALDKALAGWEQRPVAIQPEPELALRFTPSVHYAEKDMNQAIILIGHLGLNTRDENRPAVDLMNTVLGGGSFSSRIMQRVRSDEGLAYHAGSYYMDDPWTYGSFTATSQTKSDAAGRAASLIIDLIREMQESGPTAEEFEAAKQAYLNNQAFEYESKARVVQELVRLKWQGMPLDTPQRDIEAIENLTLDDVRKAARDYLHPEGLAILFVGDESQFEVPLSTFGEVERIELTQ